MKIAITGASGFVGENLKTYFNRGYDLELLKLRWGTEINSDLDVNTVIHLAGKAHDLRKVSKPSDYYESNFQLTKDLFNKFLESNASKFIYISSVKAVSDIAVDSLSEDCIPNPQTHYGRSKLMAEEYIQSSILPIGKSFFILRPCMIHGPGNKGNLNLLYQFVQKGIPYPLASFNNKRSFLSVANLCFVINELIVQDGISSGIYNVADDESLSTVEVVKILANFRTTKARLWKISPKLIRLIAKFGDLLHLSLNTERLDKLTENYVVSNRKIISAINKPLPISTREGLEITASSFKRSY